MTDTDQGVGTVDTENTQGVDTAAADNGQGAEATTETAQEDNQQPEMMTKEDAVKMANGMLARKLKGMPSKDELAEFKAWKASRMTETEKQAEQDQAKIQQAQEQEKLMAELESYRRKDQALSSGVQAKYAGYVAYEVGKLVTEDTDFETALASFMKAHPEYGQQPKSTGMRQGRAAGGGYLGGGNMVDIIKSEQPKRN